MTVLFCCRARFYGECNRYVAEAVKRYPDRIVGAGYVDPWAEECYAQLDTLIASGAFRAVRSSFPKRQGYVACIQAPSWMIPLWVGFGAGLSKRVGF